MDAGRQKRPHDGPAGDSAGGGYCPSGVERKDQGSYGRGAPLFRAQKSEALLGEGRVSVYSWKAYFREIGGKLSFAEGAGYARGDWRQSIAGGNGWYVRAIQEARFLPGVIHPARGAGDPLMVLVSPEIPAWLR